MSKVTKAVNYMKKIADDRKHGYNQWSRWGDPDTWSDYDCSSLVISAYEDAGVPVKTNGATYTGNMYSVFKKCGFVDVTDKIDLATGKGLKNGDVLLNHEHHTAMVTGSKKLTEASIDENGNIHSGKPGDQTGTEIYTHGYYNYPWNCVLRFVEATPTLPTLDKKGYVVGDATRGVYAYKQMLMIAKKLGIISQGVNDDNVFGSGTEKATNQVLKKLGYKQTGIAGTNLIQKLGKLIR